MSPFVVKGIARLRARVSLPGDKSISHRAVILAALSKGKTQILNFPGNQDCSYTLRAFRQLGLKIRRGRAAVVVYSRGPFGLQRPQRPIFTGDSGTTLRLLLGVLAGQNFSVRLTAGRSLSRRPMLRVTAPLRKMGAAIKSQVTLRLRSGQASHKSQVEEYPPILIKGGNLRGITYRIPVASAQVKSALLLAGLFARGETKIIEPLKTRDHTERMLKVFAADIHCKNNFSAIRGDKELTTPGKIFLPGDISSAVFFIVLAALIKGARLTVKKVSLNPTRLGAVRVLKRMGAKIKVTSHPSASLRAGKSQVTSFEPMGDIIVKGSSLKGTVVKKQEIPSLIDELPALMVAASLARGKTIFQGAGELRVKETDRIKSMQENLAKMGAKIKVARSGKAENIVIEGVEKLRGAKIKSFGDHRTAMSMAVAGLLAGGKTRIDDGSCINKSFPGFLSILRSLREKSYH